MTFLLLRLPVTVVLVKAPAFPALVLRPGRPTTSLKATVPTCPVVGLDVRLLLLLPVYAAVLLATGVSSTVRRPSCPIVE